MILRDYQKDIVRNTLLDFELVNKYAIQMPTGSGKTEVAIEIIKDFITKGKRAIFVIKSIKLAHQTLDRFLPHFPECGLIRASQYQMRRVNSPVNVMSIDTYFSWLNRKGIEPEEVKNADLIIIDEAHDCSVGLDPSEYVKFMRRYRDKKILGLSATFQRIGRKGHSEWDKIVAPIGGDELRILGYYPYLWLISPKIHYSMDGVRISSMTGDYSGNQVLSVLEADKHFYSDFKKQFINHHGNKKNCIVFCVNIEHTNQMYKLLKGMGVNVIIYHSDLSQKEMAEGKKLLHLSRKRQVPYTIVNVNMLSRGVDLPELDIAFMLRPTASEVLYRQMVGRLTRGTPEDNVTLVDLTTNARKFYHPYDILPPDISYYVGSLSVREEVMTTCNKCFLTSKKILFEANDCSCPGCNHPLTKNEFDRMKGIKQFDVDMEVLNQRINKAQRQINRNKHIQRRYTLANDWPYKRYYHENKREILNDLDSLFPKKRDYSKPAEDVPF